MTVSQWACLTDKMSASTSVLQMTLSASGSVPQIILLLASGSVPQILLPLASGSVKTDDAVSQWY